MADFAFRSKRFLEANWFVERFLRLVCMESTAITIERNKGSGGGTLWLVLCFGFWYCLRKLLPFSSLLAQRPQHTSSFEVVDVWLLLLVWFDVSDGNNR